MTAAGGDLLAIGDRIAAMAAGDEQIEAVVMHSRDTEIRAYDGEVEQLSSAQTQGVGIRVVRHHRQGFAYAGTFDDDVLAETLAEARDNSGFGTADEALGLAVPDGVAVPDLDLFRASLEAVPTEDKVAMAIELERAVLAADPRVSGIESCDYVDSLGQAAVVTTTGVRSFSRETACYVMASVMAAEGDDTQTGFGFSVGRHPSELDVGAAATDAAMRATRMLGATKPPSQRLTVVLDPWVTAQLLGILGSTLSGEAVLKGRSFFAGRLGEEVAAAAVTIVDDPTNPLAFSATQTDAEGLATRGNALLTAGVLNAFLHNTYTARRLATASTGSAVRAGFKSTPGVGARALSLAPGTRDQGQLLADAGEGILVQSVSGLHSGVNPVSGDFSTGAEGLRFSGGEVGAPVREFTIASTLQKMLKDVVAVGSDVEWLPMSAAGVSVVIGDVTVSGA